VSQPCSALGQSCETSDDCCNGSGAAATTECKVTDVSTVPASSQCTQKTSCSLAGQACAQNADCCQGLTCPDGGGVRVSVGAFYETQHFERVYAADCPIDTLPEWRFFEWQATIPDGTSIDFSVQTRPAGGDYDPATPVRIGTADTTTPVGSWHRGPEPLQDVLSSQLPLVRSQQELKVTMTFNPNANLGSADGVGIQTRVAA
jgi:hypothetical protein